MLDNLGVGDFLWGPLEQRFFVFFYMEANRCPFVWDSLWLACRDWLIDWILHPVLDIYLVWRWHSTLEVTGWIAKPIGSTLINSLAPGKNGRHFADDTFKCIFLNGKTFILIKISLKFVPKGPIHRENSPVTQTTPEPTLLSWSSWPCEKIFPNPWPHGKPSLIVLIGSLRPYCSQALWSCSGVSWK